MTVRIGTRASKLALTQTQQTADKLSAVGGFPVELVHIKTEGDVKTGSLSQMGGTGVFVAALRDALLADTCDVAVHSLKDLPTGAALGLSIAATPKRVDVRDVLCARDGMTLSELPGGAKVGTGSPRRAAQLRAARPDIEVLDIRGNVDTRLGRVPGLPGNITDEVVPGKSCDLDAVVLAAAGLERMDRLDTVSEFFETNVMLPAPGQGALAIECRTGDAPRQPGSTAGSNGVLAQALAALNDDDTRLAVTAERAVLARLEAGCAAPVGAYAFRKGSILHLEAVVCAVDGTKTVREKKATDGLTEVGATLLGIEVAELLLAAGAAEIADLAAS
ncbi:hydroxymethylbilane synthase [Paenarthrobacter sp. OM7]|uniref:hydroxymethylbilane synthase n=1 Tax=Paenarthrobacter sp. OM7 TaxID=3041264 RepID=UPI002468BF67|nr:hydroxymethylbilane synthase [Paenarthrobacter sp. OM7]WGM19139.1 hydroxymethylbilane synthase [Paenarthrobacter sp. OM7]